MNEIDGAHVNRMLDEVARISAESEEQFGILIGALAVWCRAWGVEPYQVTDALWEAFDQIGEEDTALSVLANGRSARAPKLAPI